MADERIEARTRRLICPICETWIEARVATQDVARHGGFYFPAGGAFNIGVVAKSGFIWVEAPTHRPADVWCPGSNVLYFVGDEQA